MKPVKSPYAPDYYELVDKRKQLEMNVVHHKLESLPLSYWPKNNTSDGLVFTSYTQDNRVECASMA